MAYDDKSNLRSKFVPAFISLFLLSRLFWSDWDRSYPRIEASNLDGSDRAVLVDSGIIMPNSLVVDMAENQLCWTDGGGGRFNSGRHRMSNQLWTGLGKIGIARQ